MIFSHNLSKAPADQSPSSALSNDTIRSPPVVALSPILFPPPLAFVPASFPLSPPAAIIPHLLPLQTTSHGMGRCPLTHTGALLHIPSTLQPAFEGLVPSHSNGQDWKVWLLGQTNHHSQLNINPILLHIITPDIRTGARLLWNYLL